MPKQDEIDVYPLSEARVMAIRGNAAEVVLAVSSGADTRHYVMQLEDLAKLASRLTLDAKLLKADRGTDLREKPVHKGAA